MSAPTHRYLSLGAGVQSSTLLLLAMRGEIPTFDAAIFADTGWEPAPVYAHLRRLQRLAAPAGIPVVQVSAGNIRRDALDPAHRFARTACPQATHPARTTRARGDGGCCFYHPLVHSSTTARGQSTHLINRPSGHR